MTKIAQNEENRLSDAPVAGSKASMKKLIAKGKERGFVSISELKKCLPSESQTEEAMELIMSSFSDMGINVVDGSEDITDLTESMTVSTHTPSVQEEAPENDTNSRINDPVRLYLKEMGGVELIKELNKIGGANGIGIADMVENRLVGMKCRGVYETPGGAILYKAHSVLETLCLDKYTMHEKQKLAITYGELVYNGQWFTPLREALAAFVDKTQEKVNGKVRLKLYKGNMINAGVWSDDSLYSEEIATFGESDYNQKDAEGFINLFGLPIKVAAMVEQGKK